MKDRKLPYDMGNAGDLLKHGVLAEFVRWRCELGRPIVRFFDLFGGEPWGCPVPEVARRVRELPPEVALHGVQTETGRGIYYGSGLVVRRTDKRFGKGEARVLTDDACQARRERLADAPDLTMLYEEFPDCYPKDRDCYDGYEAFEVLADDVNGSVNENDLVLIDPFADFLKKGTAETVVQQIAKIAERAWVLLFALNLNPRNDIGQQFERLLEKHLSGAWRMTCPPLPRDTGVRGESKYHAELVLAGPSILETHVGQNTDIYRLRKSLDVFAQHLTAALDLAVPRVVGERNISPVPKRHSEAVDISFIGIDLAWGERKPTGIAVLSWNEAKAAIELTCTDIVQTDDEIVAFILCISDRKDSVCIGIDAPIIAPNEPGTSRPCDREMSREFWRFHAGAHSANRETCERPIRLRNRLEKEGFSADPYFDKRDLCRRQIEVHPYPAQVVLFRLDRIIKYKKVKVACRRKGLNTLVGCIRTCLIQCRPMLRETPALKSLLDTDVEELRGKALDAFEDRLDAVICAYIAAYYWYWGEERCRVFGDVEHGYIVCPKP